MFISFKSKAYCWMKRRATRPGAPLVEATFPPPVPTTTVMEPPVYFQTAVLICPAVAPPAPGPPAPAPWPVPPWPPGLPAMTTLWHGIGAGAVRACPTPPGCPALQPFVHVTTPLAPGEPP